MALHRHLNALPTNQQQYGGCVSQNSKKLLVLSQNSPLYCPPALQEHLAARLADACVNPSYMPDLWATYFHRFEEVLAEDLTAREQG
jgi:hypothetical protein